MGDCEAQGQTIGHRILHDLGFFGHYMHFNVGGRSGKQHTLAKLHKAGGELSQRDLQEQSGISSAALSEVLSKLECEGLVVRERSEEDRRQMKIALTDEGMRRAAQLKESFDAFEVECLSCLTEDEKLELVGMLDRMMAHWKGIEWKEECA